MKTKITEVRLPTTQWGIIRLDKKEYMVALDLVLRFDKIKKVRK